MGEIDGITFYPLKSAKGINIRAAMCTMNGVRLKNSEIYDR